MVVGVQLPPQQQTWNGGIHEEEEMRTGIIIEQVCYLQCRRVINNRAAWAERRRAEMEAVLISTNPHFSIMDGFLVMIW